MITDAEAVNMRKFDKVYRAHADNIYKICLHYLRDEKKAEDYAVKIFFNYYVEYGVENTEDTFPRLVHEFKRLLINEYGKGVETEEQRQ